MAITKCKHPYYKYVDGRLVCSECGAPSQRQPLLVETKDKKPQKEPPLFEGKKERA